MQGRLRNTQLTAVCVTLAMLLTSSMLYDNMALVPQTTMSNHLVISLNIELPATNVWC